MKKYWATAFLFFISVTSVSAAEQDARGRPDDGTLAAQDKKIDEVFQSASDLEDRWKKAKDEFKNEMGTQVDKIEAALEKRKSALDYGDEERREKIAEDINDLGRVKADLENELSELTAASGVNIAEFKGDIDRKLADAKD